MEKISYDKFGPHNGINTGTNGIYLVNIVAIFRGSDTLFESRLPADANSKKRATESTSPNPKTARTEKEHGNDKGTDKEEGNEGNAEEEEAEEEEAEEDPLVDPEDKKEDQTKEEGNKENAEEEEEGEGEEEEKEKSNEEDSVAEDKKEDQTKEAGNEGNAEEKEEENEEEEEEEKEQDPPVDAEKSMDDKQLTYPKKLTERFNDFNKQIDIEAGRIILSLMAINWALDKDTWNDKTNDLEFGPLLGCWKMMILVDKRLKEGGAAAYEGFSARARAMLKCQSFVNYTIKVYKKENGWKDWDSDPAYMYPGMNVLQLESSATS